MLERFRLMSVFASSVIALSSASCGSSLSTGEDPLPAPETPGFAYASCTKTPGALIACVVVSGTGLTSDSPLTVDNCITQSVDLAATAPDGRSISSITCTKTDPHNYLSTSSPSSTRVRITAAGILETVPIQCTATESGGGTKTIYVKFANLEPC